MESTAIDLATVIESDPLATTNYYDATTDDKSNGIKAERPFPATSKKFLATVHASFRSRDARVPDNGERRKLGGRSSAGADCDYWRATKSASIAGSAHAEV